MVEGEEVEISLKVVEVLVGNNCILLVACIRGESRVKSSILLLMFDTL